MIKDGEFFNGDRSVNLSQGEPREGIAFVTSSIRSKLQEAGVDPLIISSDLDALALFLIRAQEERLSYGTIMVVMNENLR